MVAMVLVIQGQSCNAYCDDQHVPAEAGDERFVVVFVVTLARRQTKVFFKPIRIVVLVLRTKNLNLRVVKG